MRIRKTVHSDLSFLKQMLFEAFFWDPAVPRPPFAAFSTDGEFRKSNDADRFAKARASNKIGYRCLASPDDLVRKSLVRLSPEQNDVEMILFV